MVATKALSNGTAYLVDFAGSTMLWERDGIVIDWSENQWDATAGADFSRNLVVFRAEGRWGYGPLRPAAVVPFATA